MDKLIFRGVVNTGIGKYSELTIPGRNALSNCPADWPESLQPGSLNIRMLADGFPDALARCPGDGMQKLDSETFSPAFEISGGLIKQNRLKPKPGFQRRGDAQIWRASVCKVDDGTSFDCWLVRRIGSGLKTQLELVSDRHLRSTYSLVDGAEVEVTVFGHWKS